MDRTSTVPRAAGCEPEARERSGDLATAAAPHDRLQFGDAHACAAWLRRVPLADPGAAHELMSAQLELLAAEPMPAPERLRVLETLYPTMLRLQARLAKGFTGRALPLSIADYATWSAVIGLWQQLQGAYAECAQRGSASAEVALRCLRRIEIAAATIRDHQRACRAVPGPLWAQLHAAYASAERHGIASDAVVAAPSAPARARTCMGAYAEALLCHLSNPYTMSPRQMAVMSRWAGRWAALVDIRAHPVAPGLTAVLQVDLRGNAPAEPVRRDVAAASARYVTTDRLGQALRDALTLLRQGRTPADLGLGRDVRPRACDRLLTLLYLHWCGSGMDLQPAARERGEEARACVGLPTIARQLASEAEAFRASSATVPTAHGPLTEHWNVRSGQTAGSLGAVRGPECDTPLRHHQLVAVKRRSAASFQLAVVQWLRLEEDGDLSIGLRPLSGLPRASALQSVAADGHTGEEAFGIVLHPPRETGAPATLLLPPGVFVPGRLVALASGSVRLVRLAERGADFDRAVFEPV